MSIVFALWCVVLAMPTGSAWAAAPTTPAAVPGPVKARYTHDFSAAWSAYERLGKQALEAVADRGKTLGPQWDSEMEAADRRLAPYEHEFFPLMYKPWSRSAAVFSNLQSTRMWLWSIHDAVRDRALGVFNPDVEKDGRIHDKLTVSYDAYLKKARSLMDGGPFAGSFFQDTYIPILADYCTYPEQGKQARPSFSDPKLFGKGASAKPVVMETGGVAK